MLEVGSNVAKSPMTVSWPTVHGKIDDDMITDANIHREDTIGADDRAHAHTRGHGRRPLHEHRGVHERRVTQAWTLNCADNFSACCRCPDCNDSVQLDVLSPSHPSGSLDPATRFFTHS